MISTILHWTCDPISASMASLLFRWAIALAMLPYGVQKLFHPENAAKFPKVLFFSPKVGYYSAAIIETFVVTHFAVTLHDSIAFLFVVGYGGVLQGGHHVLQLFADDGIFEINH